MKTSIPISQQRIKDVVEDALLSGFDFGGDGHAGGEFDFPAIDRHEVLVEADAGLVETVFHGDAGIVPFPALGPRIQYCVPGIPSEFQVISDAIQQVTNNVCVNYRFDFSHINLIV